MTSRNGSSGVPLDESAAKALFEAEKLNLMRAAHNEELRKQQLAQKAGLKYSVQPTAKQAAGIAAAWAQDALGLEKQAVLEQARIGSTTLRKYTKRRERSFATTDLELVRLKGRPRKFPIVIDSAFVLWLRDASVPVSKKTMKGMKLQYRQLLREKGFATRAESMIDQSLERHIYFILDEIHWRLVTPKTLELKRCVIYEDLVEWYSDPVHEELLTTTHPLLIFNGDETEINRKSQARDMVAAEEGTIPVVPRVTPGGDHVSLFLIISASRDVVSPVPIIHR